MGKEQLLKFVAQKAGNIAKGIKTSNDFAKNAFKLEDYIVDLSKDNIFTKGCSKTCAKNIEKVCEGFRLSDGPIEFSQVKEAIKTYSKNCK